MSVRNTIPHTNTATDSELTPKEVKEEKVLSRATES